LKSNKDEFYALVYQIVQDIPVGKVATYGLIALLSGHPQRPRMVGQALHYAPAGLPCHRVVNSQGRVAPCSPGFKELLTNEGVTLKDNGYVDLKKHLWRVAEPL